MQPIVVVQSSPQPLSVVGRKAVGWFASRRILEINAIHSDGPISLHSMTCLLCELKEIYFLCKYARASRYEVNMLAGRIIQVMEPILLSEFHSFDLPQIQEMTRCGLSQTIKNQLLLIAVQNRMEIPIIQHLVERKANVFHLTENKRTLLMIAAIHANQATVRYFLSQGLNPRAKDAQGETAASLMQAHRDTALPRLPENIFFAFDSSRGYFSWCVSVGTAVMLIKDMTHIASLLAILGNIGDFSDVGIRAPCSVLYIGFLAPKNTRLCKSGECAMRGEHAFYSMIEGMLCLSYTYDVVGFEPLFGAPFVYLTLCAIALCCLPTDTFIVVCIDYVLPSSKCVHLASTVARIFFGNYPIYTTANLALYTISLLDTRSRLPAPLQKIYYFVLYTVFVAWLDLIHLCIRSCKRLR